MCADTSPRTWWIVQHLRFRAAERQATADARRRLLIVSREAHVGELHKDYVTVQLALISEYATAMRERSQPEYLYTSASIASFGAVAWGVAALTPDKFCDRAIMYQPAVVAAFGIAVTCVVVIRKIYRENSVYNHFKDQRAQAAAALAAMADNALGIPDDIRIGGAGRGHIKSAVVIGISALSTIAFCLIIATATVPECRIGTQTATPTSPTPP